MDTKKQKEAAAKAKIAADKAAEAGKHLAAAQKAVEDAKAVAVELGSLAQKNAEIKAAATLLERVNAAETKLAEVSPEVHAAAVAADELAHATQNPAQDNISEEDRGDAYESTPKK